MTDLKRDITPHDPGRINAMDPVELQYWCKELGCTDEELKDAVAKAGEHVTAVREQLNRRQ